MNHKPFIELPNNFGYEFINQNDIITVCSNDKYIIFTFENRRKIKLRGTMAKVEEVLTSPDLIRCHLRHFINLRKVICVLKQRKGLIMSSGEEIPISQSYRKMVFDAHGQLCNRWRG